MQFQPGLPGHQHKALTVGIVHAGKVQQRAEQVEHTSRQRHARQSGKHGRPCFGAGRVEQQQADQGAHSQRRHRKRQGRQPVVDARQNQPGNHCPGKAQAQQGAHAFPAADGHHRGGKHRQDQHQYRGAVVIVYGIVSIRAVGQVLTDNGGFPLAQPYVLGAGQVVGNGHFGTLVSTFQQQDAQFLGAHATGRVQLVGLGIIPQHFHNAAAHIMQTGDVIPFVAA